MKPPQKPRKPRSLVAERVPPREKVGSIFSAGRGGDISMVIFVVSVVVQICGVIKERSCLGFLLRCFSKGSIIHPVPPAFLHSSIRPRSSARLLRIAILEYHSSIIRSPLSPSHTPRSPSLLHRIQRPHRLTPTKQQRRRSCNTPRPNRIVARTHISDHPAGMRIRIDERVRSLRLFDRHDGRVCRVNKKRLGWWCRVLKCDQAVPIASRSKRDGSGGGD